jgi:nitronate monooxygenase
MKTKAWKDIWGSGQGIGSIEKVQTIEDVVADMERDYRNAIDSLVQRAS